MDRTKWLSRVYVYTIHATTHIPRYKLCEAEFLSFIEVSLFAFFRADISNALRYLCNCLVRITEIVQLLASGHKMNGCLQLPDLQFLSTDSCTDSEEAGNSRTHQMQKKPLG